MQKRFSFSFLFFLVVIYILQCKPCYGQWAQCNFNFGVSVYSLASNADNIFAGTYSKGVFISTDNGASWIQTNLGYQTVFSLASSGYKIFAGTYISLFYTENSGYSWTRIGLNNRYIYSIATNGNNIFVGTSATGIFRSTNNGDNWTQTTLDNQHVYSIAINGSNIFAGTYYGVFLSTNNGSSWIWTELKNHIVSALAVSGNNVYAGVTDNGIFVSTNNGSTWTQTALRNVSVNSLVICLNNIFAGTTYYGLYLSTDNGTTWVQKNEGFDITPTISTILIKNNYIFAGTYSNNIWKRSYAEITGEQIPEIPNEYSISQNFPNPFNAKTNIIYKIAGTGIVKITINNVIGKEIATLKNEIHSPGIYEISWYGSEYSSGIYFYSLFVDGVRIDTKRMVLIK